MSRILIGVALFIAFLAILTWQMIGGRKNRVEVCMTYQGRTMCKTASGATTQEAIRTATDAACSLIASGMSNTRTCATMPPTSVRKLD